MALMMPGARHVVPCTWVLPGYFHTLQCMGSRFALCAMHCGIARGQEMGSDVF